MQKKRERLAYRSDRKAYFIDPFLYRVFYMKFFGTHVVQADRLPYLAEGKIWPCRRKDFLKSDLKTRIILSKNDLKTIAEVMIIPISIFLAALWWFIR